MQDEEEGRECAFAKSSRTEKEASSSTRLSSSGVRVREKKTEVSSSPSPSSSRVLLRPEEGEEGEEGEAVEWGERLSRRMTPKRGCISCETPSGVTLAILSSCLRMWTWIIAVLCDVLCCVVCCVLCVDRNKRREKINFLHLHSLPLFL